MNHSRWSRALIAMAARLDRTIGWHRLPVILGIPTLVGLRDRLRQENLLDTGEPRPPLPPEPGPDQLTFRSLDGSYNDLETAVMGTVGARFGRNVPLDRTSPDPMPRLVTPNPRTVSRELLARRTFIPARSLNMLAAAWIQFEVHDWFNHGDNEIENPWAIPLDEDDHWPERPMQIRRTRRDPNAGPSAAPTYVSTDTHWWDASQLYGTSDVQVNAFRAREDGRLRVGSDGLPPEELEEKFGPPGGRNSWIGLAFLHTLFTREHNAICDRLRRANPSWSDERLFQTARLVNSALITKIHTIEWTPALLAHPTTSLAMHINWSGLFKKPVTRFGPWRGSDFLFGIPGSPHDHHGVPYALTEEFVSVYRMHPLMPDELTFRSARDGSYQATHALPELLAPQWRQRTAELSAPTVWYSLGISHPGAVTLHNYPAFLRDLHRLPVNSGDPIEHVDLAATDVMRDRERGVPRYNDFRRLLHRPPVRSFDEVTSNPAWVEELRRIYDDDVELIDLMVGLLAESPPRGFAFSDTAFRVFILMASRRLKSDRFMTDDYKRETYGDAGMAWINDNSMKTVLLRHYPALAPALDGVDNPFRPWRAVLRA